MAESVDREVNTGAVECRGGAGGEDIPRGASAWPGITQVSDEDYRCVWRPCHALEEGEGDATAG
jgi:hypothetical protein